MLTTEQMDALEKMLYNKAMEGDMRVGLQLLKVQLRDADPQKPTPGKIELPDILPDPEAEEEWL